MSDIWKQVHIPMDKYRFIADKVTDTELAQMLSEKNITIDSNGAKLFIALLQAVSDSDDRVDTLHEYPGSNLPRGTWAFLLPVPITISM